jgi:Spy/CpxP family protein refolding chaperone
MNSRKLFEIAVAVAGVLMAGSTLALAQGPGGRGDGPGFGEHRPPFERALGANGEHGKWWNNPRVVADLKLTDDQRKAMDGILLEHREQLIDLRAGVDKAELGMEPLMGQDQPDEARILAQIDKVAQARAELEKANARFLLALRAKLTPEQWKQLQANRQRMQANRASHGEEGRGWGHDGQGRDGQGPGGPGGQYHHRQGPPATAPGQAAPAGTPAAPSGDTE